jgi:hypothetical protein
MASALGLVSYLRDFIPLVSQTRYSATDREHLALVDAAKWFRVFLHRNSGVTRVHSDHKALVGKRSPD